MKKRASGRVLGVDPGSVRVGLALSDETRVLATPLETLANRPDLPVRIAEIVRERGAVEVVVGLPLQLDGTDGDGAKQARELAQKLKSQGLAVELWDERMTSRIAERSLDAVRRRRRRTAKTGAVDRAAAAVMLQSYLDRTPTE